MLYAGEFFWITKNGIWMCYAIVKFGLILHIDFSWALGWDLCFKKRRRRGKGGEEGEEIQLSCTRTRRRKKGKERAMMARVWNFVAPLWWTPSFFELPPNLPSLASWEVYEAQGNFGIKRFWGPIRASLSTFHFFSKPMAHVWY